MTRDDMFKFYCTPLLVLSVLAVPAFVVYDHFIEFNAFLLFAAPVLFLAAWIPWLAVEHFKLLKWKDV